VCVSCVHPAAAVRAASSTRGCRFRRTTPTRHQTAALQARCGTPMVRWTDECIGAPHGLGISVHQAPGASTSSSSSTARRLQRRRWRKPWACVSANHVRPHAGHAQPHRPQTIHAAHHSWRLRRAVFPDGRVCISILHNPGDDPHGYETAAERWSPVQSVETIMISIISMLSSPNDESPANVDAAKEWREDKDGFKKKVSRIVRKSQEML